MTERNEHVDELIDIYALGALEPSEQAIVDDHIRICERCQGLLSESKRVAAALAWTPTQYEPPAELRDRILEGARQSRPSVTAPVRSQAGAPKRWWGQLNTPTGSSRTLGARRVMGVGALLLILSLLGNTLRMQGQIRQLQTTAAIQQQLVGALRTPGARVVAFAATGATQGHSQLLINTADNQAYLLTDGLPVLPADKTYQLWLIRGKQPVGANVFHVDPQGTATVAVQVPAHLADYQAAGITVEPAGGSVAPTTQPFLLTQF